MPVAVEQNSVPEEVRYVPSKKQTVIFRRYITRAGKVLDAHDYGLKAWPIRTDGKAKPGAKPVNK